MGVLIVSGSPRKNGNTDILLSVFDKELKKNNISTKFISLSGKKINHCINCDKCIGINRCIQKDDFNSIYDDVLKNKGFGVGVHKGDIQKDEKAKSYIVGFAQNLAWLIKSLEA